MSRVRFSIHFLSINVSFAGSQVVQVRMRGWCPRRRFVADLLIPYRCHEGTQQLLLRKGFCRKERSTARTARSICGGISRRAPRCKPRGAASVSDDTWDEAQLSDSPGAAGESPLRRNARGKQPVSSSPNANEISILGSASASRGELPLRVGGAVLGESAGSRLDQQKQRSRFGDGDDLRHSTQ